MIYWSLLGYCPMVDCPTVAAGQGLAYAVAFGKYCDTEVCVEPPAGSDAMQVLSDKCTVHILCLYGDTVHLANHTDSQRPQYARCTHTRRISQGGGGCTPVPQSPP